jgi:hypothetical protein
MTKRTPTFLPGCGNAERVAATITGNMEAHTHHCCSAANSVTLFP